MKLRAILAIAMVAGASANIMAQPAQPADPTITVTGIPLTREEIRRETKDYIRQTGIAEGIKPAARWSGAICPTVIGLNAANAARVRQKIEDVARSVGIGTSPAPCTSNIVVGFGHDGSDLTRRIAKRRSKMGDGDIRSRQLLVESDAPVRWWYSSSLTGRYGGGPSSGDKPGTEGNREGGGSAIPGGDMISMYNSSIVSTQVKRVLTGATVIVDVGRAEGTRLDAIAALAALVTLAEIETDAKPAGSILSLFPAGSGIEDLSETDRQMLKSLYTLSLDRHARYHRGRLLNDIVQAKTPSPDPAKSK